MSRSRMGRAAELDGGEIDRDDGRGDPQILPGAELLASGIERPPPQRGDTPSGLRDADECIGEQQAAGRVIPARQCFQGDNAAGGEIDHGLEVQLQVAALEGHAQLIGDGDALVDLGVELRTVEAVAVAALGLGAVEREVGLLEHVLRLGQLGRVGRDADTRGDLDIGITDRERDRDRACDVGSERP